MPDDKVRVRAAGTALCPDFDAMDRGMRRKIGRDLKEVEPGQFAWVPRGEAEEVAKRQEIARAIADGDLEADDQATADWAFAVTRVKVKPRGAEAPPSSIESTALETPEAKAKVPPPPPTKPDVGGTTLVSLPEPTDTARPEPTLGGESTRKGTR